MKLQEHIFLIGFMGVGKTSTSRQLSRKLGVREVDTDAMIVEMEKRSIAKIFEESGEPYFRSVETGTLDTLADQKPCIVSCGGGWQCVKKCSQNEKDRKSDLSDSNTGNHLFACKEQYRPPIA